MNEVGLPKNATYWSLVEMKDVEQAQKDIEARGYSITGVSYVNKMAKIFYQNVTKSGDNN